MEELHTKYTMTKMAKVFGVSRSGYYAWIHRPPSLHTRKDQELLQEVLEIFNKNHRRYGSPRVYAEMRSRGIRVGKKRIERLMRAENLYARPRRRWKRTTDSRHGYGVSENILNREFKAGSPGEKWVSDITYVRTRGGWLYLTIVLDLYDRKIVGWNVSGDLQAVGVCKALEMAALNRKPRAGMLFHSDRGIQYCSEDFRKCLKKVCPTVCQSMSRKGNCWDNACAESFFKTLKEEVYELGRGYSSEEVQAVIFEYIEIYYNKHRRHSAIGYVAPDAFSPVTVA